MMTLARDYSGESRGYPFVEALITGIRASLARYLDECIAKAKDLGVHES